MKIPQHPISLIILLLFTCSFDSIDKDSEYTKLQRLEHMALRNGVGKTYVRDLAGRKDCNKSRVKYLGILKTKKGKKFKILTSFFVFSAASTCHASSCIKIFDMENKYVGEYYGDTFDDLPYVLRSNKLLYFKNLQECALRKSYSINLEQGLPKTFFVPCSKIGGGVYSFTSGR